MAIHVDPSGSGVTGVKHVQFHLDGRFVRTETDAPFDFLGTQRNGAATMLDTGQLAPGAHTVKAQVATAKSACWSSATFTVKGTSPRPPWWWPILFWWL